MKIGQGSYRERAIILHSTKYGERRLIVHTLTIAHGRMSYITTIGNGANSISRGMVQPLFVIDFQSNESQGSMHTIRDAQLCPPTQTWSTSPAKSMIVMFIAELLYRLVNDSDEAMFTFIEDEINALRRLDTVSEATALANFHLHFMTHLAAHLGYAPTDNHTIGDYFDIKQGCFVPFRPVSHALYFEPEIARILSDMLVTPKEDTGKIALSRDMRRKFLCSMVDYFGFHTQSIYSVRSIELFSF